MERFPGESIAAATPRVTSAQSSGVWSGIVYGTRSARACARMGDEERRRRVLELLAPDGEPLGVLPRSKRPVRRVEGGQAKAMALFEELARLGEESPVQNPADRTQPGRRVAISGFGFVSYRKPADEAGEVTPTIQCGGNVSVQVLQNVKFKFVRREDV